MKSQRAKMLTRMVAALLLALILLPATAFAGELELDVYSVKVTLTEPSVGNTPDMSPTVVAKEADTAFIDGQRVSWAVTSNYTGNPFSTDWDFVDQSTTFESGKYYGVSFLLKAEPGYSITIDTVITVNGQTPDYVELRDADAFVIFVFDRLPDAHTHTYNPDVWNSNASQHWHECTDANCTDKAASIKDIADHTFTWVVDREATATEEGLKHEVCTVCGFTRSENTAIAKLDSSKLAPAEGTPKTGDTLPGAMAAVALGAGAVVAGSALLRKRSQQD